MQLDALAHWYASKTDDELLLLAADPNSLLEEARLTLAEELRRRNLDAELIPSGLHSPNYWNATLRKLICTIGAFLLNLAIAIFGTAMTESSAWAVLGRSGSVSEVVFREWLLSITIAAVLGFFVFRRWHTRTAMWVWILPVAFFGLGVFFYTSSASSTIISNSSLAGNFLAPDCTGDPAACRAFFIFTVPAARTAAYSAAAWASSQFYGTALAKSR